MWRKNTNLTSPDHEKMVRHCSKEVGAVGMTPSNPWWISPNTRPSLPDKVNSQFCVCVYYYEHPKQVLPFQSGESPKSRRALQTYNSPGDWARELSKPCTDSASLVVKIEKKRFSISVGEFWRWRHKEGMFWKFWPHLAGPGPRTIDPLF